jgi:hypothetical protein
MDGRGSARLLPELSNFCCLPGRAGGSPLVISHAIRVDPVTHSGLIILSGGESGFAHRLAADWGYWKTGNGADVRGIALAPFAQTIAFGAGVIVVLVAAWVIRDARSRRRPLG